MLNQSTTTKLKPWIILASLILAFILPYVAAKLLYNHGQGWLSPSKQHGVLLNSPYLTLDQLASKPEQHVAKDKWLLLYADNQQCDQQCVSRLKILENLKQIAGKNISRLQFGLLSTKPLTKKKHQALLKAIPELLFLNAKQKALQQWVDRPEPNKLNVPGFFIIDPHHNVILNYQATVDTKFLYEDLNHLLKASRIG